jgi:hypothetical protein
LTDTKREIVALFDFWAQRFQARLADLTDEEFWWEPAPDCWKIFPDGSGGDFGLVFGEEAPVTTLGWRVTHIIDLLKEDRCATYLGLVAEPSAAVEWIPTSAQQARQMVRDACDTFRRYIEAGDFEHQSPRAFSGGEANGLNLVLHVIDEVIHHGAEVGLLRDLYRAAQPKDAFVSALLRADRSVISDTDEVARVRAERPDLMVEAAATARWAAVPLLLELGFPIEGAPGRSALHHAAAKGDLALVQLLVDHGADTNAIDGIFKVKPAMWAQFFNQAEVADFLDRVGTRADGQ